MKLVTTTIALMAFASVGLAEVTLGSREVLLDNDAVEIVRLTYPPGSESGMHTHEYPNRAAYFVKGGLLEVVPKDDRQTPQVLEAPEGKAFYLPSATHNVRNIGDTEIVIIETEIKQ